MSVSEAPVLAEVRNRIAHLTLNRPASLNALTLPMIRLIKQYLVAWEHSATVVAVVLRAAGDKAFCVGGDVHMFYDSYHAGSTLHERFFEEEYALDAYIHAYPKPIVALMDGLAYGGGMGLAQGASIRVVTERAQLGMPEVAVGFFPDVASSYFLPRLPGELGIYLGVTGVQIRAADALYSGLADWCIARSQIAELDHCLNKMSWTNRPKDALRALFATLGVARLAGSELEAMRPAIDEHFAKPDLPRIRASLLSESHPEFQTWARTAVDVLDRQSPLAMAVTLELLRRGRSLSLTDCFAQELHLGCQWFERGNLMEGIRSVFIDKDKCPSWSPPTLGEVDGGHVDTFFSGFKPSGLKDLVPVPR